MADSVVPGKDVLDEVVIPASPNWYCSTATSCSGNGYLAFAARNQIFIYDISKRHPKFKDSFQIYKERITSVCWIGGNQLIFAFGGEDGIVRVLDAEKRKVIADSKRQNSKISAMVSSEGGIILSGDEKGLIVSWDYKKSNCSTWLPISAPIFSLSYAPRSETLIAVGYGNGHVLVCDVAMQNIIQHYKSHLDEVHSVVWQPFSNSLEHIGKDFHDDGLLIASGSKDKTIRVWDIEKDNPLLTLNIPAKTSGYKGRRKVDEMNRAKLWIAMCWHKKDFLISSSNSGELLIWDLKTKNSKCIIPAHSRVIFNISYDCTAVKIVTTSMDRQVMFWDAESYELLTSMPSLGGYIYSVTASYLDPYRIIYGIGDNLIRVWNTRFDDNPFETNLIWQGIKSKVTVVECHPTKESVVGFGTDDGHVGIYNISSGKYQVSVSYHKKTVYSLSWGPHCNDEAEGSSLDGNWLYSCGGEGIILAHAMNNLENKAKDINALIRRTNSIQSKEKLPPRSDVEWKKDFKYVAIGNDDGSVDIYSSPILYKICTILVHRKIINCMKWNHHLESLEDMKGSTFSSWLATGSSDNYVCVTDLSSVLERSISDKQITVIKEKFRYFNMHSQRITCLSWSPHSVELLASSSYDGSVQIWNIVKNEPIANFHSHTGRVLCVLWSLIHPDIVYSGAEDFTLRRWAISACKNKVPSDMKKSSSQKGNSEKKVRYNSSTPKEQNQDKESKEAGERELEEGDSSGHIQSLSDSTIPKVLNSEEPDISQPQAAREFNEVSQSKARIESIPKRASSKGELRKKKGKSLLPLSSSQNHKQKSASQKECVLLAQYLQDKSRLPASVDEFEPGTNEFVNLGLFGDRISALKMFSSEEQNHGNTGNIEQQLHLELWKGNLGGALQTCKERGELNEMIVAMSPLGGYDVWQATVQAYGDQLASKADYVTAATYYVAINKVNEAISMFKAQNMFKEAISLAKVRLPRDDPILFELYQLWGDRHSAEACYENAAKCYIASGDHKTAIKILARKGDISSLKTAAQVAIIYKENEIANEYLKQSASIGLTDLNWKEVKEMTNMMENCEDIVLQAVTHEMLAHCFTGTEISESLNLPYHIEKNMCYITVSSLKEIGTCGGNPNYLMKATPFLQAIASTFHRELGKDLSSEAVRSKNLLAKKSDEINLNNVLLNISFEITTGIVSLLEHDIKNCLMRWLSAIDILYRVYQIEALEILYKLLFPRDFITLENLAMLSLPDDDRTEILAVFHNFHSYYQTSILFQFWWRRFPFIMVKEHRDINCDLDNVVKEHFCVSKENLVASVLRRFEATNLVVFIGSLAMSILSSLHCKLSQLRMCTKDTEQDILELRIKKQLRMHILSKEQESKTRKQPKVIKVVEGNDRVKLSACDDDDDWRGTKKLKNEDDEKEIKAVTEDKENKKLSNMVENDQDMNKEACLLGKEIERVNEKRLQLMQEEFDEMKKELKELELMVQTHSFPNGLENAKILLHIIVCSVKNGILKDARGVKKLLGIADDVVSWGLKYSLLADEKQSFERFRARLHSFKH